MSLFLLLIKTLSHKLDSELRLDKSPRGRQRGIVQLRLGTDEQAAAAGKLEVGGACAQEDLAQQRAGRAPDVHAVATAGVDVAVGVDVDTLGVLVLASASGEVEQNDRQTLSQKGSQRGRKEAHHRERRHRHKQRSCGFQTCHREAHRSDNCSSVSLSSRSRPPPSSTYIVAGSER